MTRDARPTRAAVLLALGLCACTAPKTARVPAARPCPAEAPAPPVLPFQRPEHSLVELWLSRTTTPSQVVMDAERIARHNSALLLAGETATSVRDLLASDPGPEAVRALLQRRLLRFERGVAAGKRVLEDGTSPRGLLAGLRDELGRAELVSGELRVAHRAADLRCFPFDDGLYEVPWDLAFDLAQCSGLRLGEVVRVLARGKRRWFVRTAYTDGWVDPRVLTPALTPEQARAYLAPERGAVVVADRLPLFMVEDETRLAGVARLGARFPVEAEQGDRLRVTVPTPGGLGSRLLSRHGVTLGYAALTREALLRRAFALLDSTYGWGDVGGLRDCSRLLMDLFGSFGVLLPRNSWHQSQAGTRRVDVGSLPDGAKMAAIEKEAERGLVLLYMPGHIMLYLGRDGDHLYALHLFSGYLRPCAGGGETMLRVNRLAVTSLELGRGGSRRAFIQRITRLIVFGP